ncbi:SDR family oxidoreductase [Saccharothrix sp. S26]|uniref:SDR family oxidoreductase n=1 Tax=Saccharothrix sp. S26 TaxID=2907215 RepID=UPI001F1819AE|nr:SDR family oxidoreductase [Saccharothrix sp. S26]MCE6993966.1 SDR family oxidoreductase [Saccharothrix sp. S26]
MTVLMSGGTGFLGLAVLRRLREPVVAVIRGRDFEQRGRSLARRSGAEVEAVEGDLRLPNWGLTDRQVDDLRGRVRVVLNVAGDVAWSAPWSRLAKINIDGAEQGAELARRLGAKLVHAGSLYVGYESGDEVGEVLLEEKEKLTKYERSKLRGEWAVARAARKYDVPSVIARIPALSGDLDPVSGEGGSGAKKVPLARLITSGWFKVLPYSTGARLDVCPRDLVAARLVELVDGTQQDLVDVHNIGQAAAAPFVESFIREASVAAQREPQSFPRPVRMPPNWLKAISLQADRLDEHPRNAAVIGLRYFASRTVYTGTGLGREVSVRSLVKTLGMPLHDDPPKIGSYYAGWPA